METFIRMVLSVIPFMLYVWFFAWIVMLIVGGLHHEVDSDIPAVSYGGSVLTVVLIDLLFTMKRSRDLLDAL